MRRTHLFNGRYENIYLNETHIPELTELIDEANMLASSLLNQQDLRAGFWFNHMPPGSITLPHRHDDDDELLSAAYYVSIPENSGELIVHAKPENIHIQPKAGMFIFFSPDAVHEVSKNMSTYHRLSIGINFGVPTKEAD